jgi:hypothetical protein
VEEDELHEAVDDDDLEDVELQMEINENEEDIGDVLVSILSFFGTMYRTKKLYKEINIS